MPTPSDRATQLAFGTGPHLERLLHTICPPESERSGTWRREDEDGPDPDDIMDIVPSARQQDCAAAEIEATGLVEDINHNDETPPVQTFKQTDTKMNNVGADSSMPQGSTPMSISSETTTPESTTTGIKELEKSPSPPPMTETIELCSLSSSHYGIPNVRVCSDFPYVLNRFTSKERKLITVIVILQMIPTHTSSFLRNGSKFRGTQQSDKQQYKVEVEIKYVDMAESFLCGYLRIEGLPVLPPLHLSTPH